MAPTPAPTGGDAGKASEGGAAAPSGAGGAGGAAASASAGNAGKKTDKAGKKDEKKAEELSEEDQLLKAQLEQLVETLKDADTSLHLPALEALRTLIRTATSSMTSVPKPLKFLRPHFDTLIKRYEEITDTKPKASPSARQRSLADILSVLAMTMGDPKDRATLRYRLAGSDEAIGSWGHEYVRYLSSEVIAEYNDRIAKVDEAVSCDDLFAIAREVVPFNMQHNAEADACDLLMELERIGDIVDHVDKANYARVCLYLSTCVNYVPEPEDRRILDAVLAIYRRLEFRTEALTTALRMNDLVVAKDIFETCPDVVEKRQLAYILARQQVRFPTGDDALDEVMNNTRLADQFEVLAKELDVVEPKTAEDVYKSQMEPRPALFGNAQADSAKANLAISFVNGFVNAGFRKDKLLTTEDGQSWIFKHKEHGMLSATAALGLVYLWDVDVGLTQVDKYLYSPEDMIKAGALLAVGVISASIHNDYDPALSLLSDQVTATSPILAQAAIAGLGIAYAGHNRSDVLELLEPAISNVALAPQTSALAALSVGLVGIASCSRSLAESIVGTLLDRDGAKLKTEPLYRFFSLGLALLYLGRQQAADATLEALQAVPAPLSKQGIVLVKACAYAGTGNVLKIQELLQVCKEHVDPEKEDDVHQALAVLGIALIAMGEEIGSEMAIRSFNHLMHYGELVIRRAVPLALGLLCVSNPQEINVLDTLSKYSHDNDAEVSQAAIFALGLVGAGTNNARVALLLRQLSQYYQKDANNLFVVRLAQGLLHMSKGTVSIAPYHSNRQLMSPVAVASLLTVLVSFLDVKNMRAHSRSAAYLGRYHWVLFYLAIAIHPRMLMTLDEAGKPLTVTVRVGHAVDVVGQAGRPKTITGFQTHTTPVLLGHGERAELATEEYLPLSKVLEGLVILRKNPDYVPEPVPEPRK